MSSAAILSNNDRGGYNDSDVALNENVNNTDSTNDVGVANQKKNVITPQLKKSKASKKQRAKLVATTKTSLDHRMAVEKNVVDELLLVCGVIGTTTNSGNELVPVTDCLNWLQDLQRALRRDDDSYRPISLLLGKWKIVEQKLLPLVVTCRYDTPIVLTVLKILVILTKPLSDTSQRAGQMIIDTTSSKSDPAVVAQQIKLRQNALSQAEQLMEYKRLITFHPSNFEKKKSKTKKGTGILSVFVSLLAEPLSKSGASRTDADHLTIELVLHLIRNLLSAHPLLNSTLSSFVLFLTFIYKDMIGWPIPHIIMRFLSFFPCQRDHMISVASSETPRQAAQLHQDMIVLFEKELVLEILLVVGQEMELRENAQYNLLMMEILHHIVKMQDPTAVARSSSSKGTDSFTKTSASVSNSKSNTGKKISDGARSSTSALASKLKRERSQLNNMKSVRHGHFSGTWMRRQAEGKRQFIAASSIVKSGSSSGGSSQSRGLVQARRKNRLAEPFIGSGKSLFAHTRYEMQVVGSGGPSAKRANQTMHDFCKRFLADCYGPFMKSIKNEFRRDSQRLEEKDKVVFFKLVWFFSQWSRVSSSSSRRTAKEGSDEAIGRLIITMDVFTFNLVLTATDTFYQRKQYTRMAQAVALYAEMMHLLHSMYTSKDKTEHEMAMGLMDRLFYHGQDALDQLPKLLSRWTPGTYTREYLCDLIEVAHMSLKLLEANQKRGMEFVMNKSRMGNSETAKFSKKIAKMRKDASEFDVKGYFVRKIVSNQLISMYSHLLDQYKINAAVVNHRIVAMFLRVMRLVIATPEAGDEEERISPLETRRVTLEPMLYNLQVIMVIERILNDDSIQKDRSFESLIKFSTSLMYKFWSAANTNPMLYVECLFQHVTPHRFCESVTNIYVNDELRMMAEREILHEDQLMEGMQSGDEYGMLSSERNDDDDDDEAELEFTGEVLPPPSSSNDENPISEKDATEDTENDSKEVEKVPDSLLSNKRDREDGNDPSNEKEHGSTDEAVATEEQDQRPKKIMKSAIQSEDDDDDDDIQW